MFPSRLWSIHWLWPPSPPPPPAIMLLTKSWRTCVNTATLWFSRPSWYRHLILLKKKHCSNRLLFGHLLQETNLNCKYCARRPDIWCFIPLSFLKQCEWRVWPFLLHPGEWGAYPSGHLVAWDVARGPWRGFTSLLWRAQRQGHVCCAGASTCYDGEGTTDPQRDLF